MALGFTQISGRGFPERVLMYNSSRERALAQGEIFRLAGSHGNLCEGEMDFISAFDERVGRRLKDMLQDAQRENETILGRMSAKGLGHSGPRIQEQLNATQRELYCAGADSNQESNFTVSPASVETALSQLVAALSGSGIDQITRDEINAEIGTVQIQLKRSTPNLSVIRAAVNGGPTACCWHWREHADPSRVGAAASGWFG